MGKVYVVQNHMTRNGKGKLVPRFNLDPAEKFGELVYLLSPETKPFQPDGVMAALHGKLRNFNDDDNILLIGNPALIAYAFAVAHYYNGRVSVLQWNGKKREYIQITADPLKGALHG